MIYNNSREEKVALENINLEIEKGELINILGHNGSGKSTILKLVTRDIEPTNGVIKYYDSDISKFHNYEWSLIVGKVYQNPSFGLITQFSVYQNLLMNWLKVYNLRLFSNTEGEKTKKMIKDRFAELIESSNININFNLNKIVALMSGGEKQLLSLICLYFQNPQILVLDEPTSALDANNLENFLSFLTYWVETDQVTVLMVSHIKKIALPLKTRIVTLKEGKIETIKTKAEYEKG